MTIPSHLVGKGDSVTVREGSKTSPLFANRTEKAVEFKTPHWIKMNADGVSFMITDTPSVAATEAPFNPATIIQFYSR